MRLSLFATLAAVASFALAGCAVEGTDDTGEQVADSQQTASITDSRLKDAVDTDFNAITQHDRAIVDGVNDNSLERRMYDFSAVMRVGEVVPQLDINQPNIDAYRNALAKPLSAPPGVAGPDDWKALVKTQSTP